MSAHNTIYLRDYSKTDFTITRCNLEFDLYEEYVTVKNVMRVQCQKGDARVLLLHGEKLELVRLQLDGLEVSYTKNETTLTLEVEKGEFELSIETKIYPQNNTELEGLYRSNGMFCTQNEPEGFRKITYFLDRPDVLSLFETKIIADKKRYPILLSNGNLKAKGEVDSERHYAIWEDPFYKPTYLFALVAGDLGCVNDSFITCNNRTIELNIYVDKGNEAKCEHAMRSLKNAMKWDEQTYGLEYDLDIYNIVAVDSFNMGAMENKGLNIFNSHYVLANSDTATDANFLGIESVIAHEYFHNYSGNRVTCRDWFQLTLKEGLTVFRDQSFSGDMNSKVIQRIDDVSALRERQFVEDASPTAHPIRPESYIQINNFYTSTVYEKGAEVIRMLQTLVGEEQFIAGCKLYFKTFDAQAVTCEDFIGAIEKASGMNLSEFMRWYHQERTPILHVDSVYNAKQGSMELTCRQEIPLNTNNQRQECYMYPLNVAFFDEKGVLLDERRLVITQESETFSFEGINANAKVSINRNFSAPIIVEYDAYDYPFLMRYESDGFSRFEAAQNFAKSVLMTLSEGGSIPQSYFDAYEKLLDDEGIDKMFKAKLLSMPSISELMQLQTSIDVQPLYSAKSTLQKALALKFKERFEALYHNNHFPQTEDISSLSMAQRALKNRAMGFLMTLEEGAIFDLCEKQYQDSLTMTDRITALDLLENYDAKRSSRVLQDFYERYRDDTLVMNKYFSIISASMREGTLQRLIEAQKDECFDVKVPNLVRSLYGVFSRNYKHFHAKDGSGYDFIASKIIEIDAINPQIASGLSSAFKSYNRLNSENRALMQKALDKILVLEHLSDNVYEIVGKIVSNS